MNIKEKTIDPNKQKILVLAVALKDIESIKVISSSFYNKIDLFSATMDNVKNCKSEKDFSFIFNLVRYKVSKLEFDDLLLKSVNFVSQSKFNDKLTLLSFLSKEIDLSSNPDIFFRALSGIDEDSLCDYYFTFKDVFKDFPLTTCKDSKRNFVHYLSGYGKLDKISELKGVLPEDEYKLIVDLSKEKDNFGKTSEGYMNFSYFLFLSGEKYRDKVTKALNTMNELNFTHISSDLFSRIVKELSFNRENYKDVDLLIFYSALDLLNNCNDESIIKDTYNTLVSVVKNRLDRSDVSYSDIDFVFNSVSKIKKDNSIVKYLIKDGLFKDFVYNGDYVNGLNDKISMSFSVSNDNYHGNKL